MSVKICPHCNNRDDHQDPHRELRLGKINLMNIRVRDDETDYQYHCTSCTATWWNYPYPLGRYDADIVVGGKNIKQRQPRIKW